MSSRKLRINPTEGEGKLFVRRPITLAFMHRMSRDWELKGIASRRTVDATFPARVSTTVSVAKISTSPRDDRAINFSRAWFGGAASSIGRIFVGRGVRRFAHVRPHKFRRSFAWARDARLLTQVRPSCGNERSSKREREKKKRKKR